MCRFCGGLSKRFSKESKIWVEDYGNRLASETCPANNADLNKAKFVTPLDVRLGSAKIDTEWVNRLSEVILSANLHLYTSNTPF